MDEQRPRGIAAGERAIQSAIAAGFSRSPATPGPEHRLRPNTAAEGQPAPVPQRGGNSSRSGSVVTGSRGPARSSPAAQPAIRPTVSASARTLG